MNHDNQTFLGWLRENPLRLLGAAAFDAVMLGIPTLAAYGWNMGWWG